MKILSFYNRLLFLIKIHVTVTFTLGYLWHSNILIEGIIMEKSHNKHEHQRESILEKTLEEVTEFFHIENDEPTLDHREKFKDEDGCARYDDLWGG